MYHPILLNVMLLYLQQLEKCETAASRTVVMCDEWKGTVQYAHERSLNILLHSPKYKDRLDTGWRCISLMHNDGYVPRACEDKTLNDHEPYRKITEFKVLSH